MNEESSTESDGPPEEMQVADPLAQLSSILPLQEDEDMLTPNKEPQLYLCDDWIQPVEVVRKPKELHAKDKVRANVAKNCLIVTLMSLNVEEVLTHVNEFVERSDLILAAPAAMPPSTVLARQLNEVSANNSETAVVKVANLKCIVDVRRISTPANPQGHPIIRMET